VALADKAEKVLQLLFADSAQLAALQKRFSTLRKRRNDMFHSGKTSAAGSSTEDAQGLFSEVLRAYFRRPSDGEDSG